MTLSADWKCIGDLFFIDLCRKKDNSVYECLWVYKLIRIETNLVEGYTKINSLFVFKFVMDSIYRDYVTGKITKIFCKYAWNILDFVI